MKTDPLERLLKEADAAAGPVQVLDGLAAGVHRRVARRRAGRRLAVAAGVMLAVGAGLAVWKEHTLVSTSSSLQSVAPVVAGDGATAGLEAEAKLAAIDYLVACEQDRNRLAQLELRAARPDPRELVAVQVDRAAQLGLVRADALAQSRDQRSAAIAAYRLVIDLFPETHWAALARAKLKDIENPKGGWNYERTRGDGDFSASGLDRDWLVG